MYIERRLTAARHRPIDATPRSRILCYHTVGTPSWGANDVPPWRFARHIELARQHGYRFASPAEVRAKLAAPRREGPPLLAFTFDDGARTVGTNAAPLLERAGAPFVVFVVTEWADRADADAGAPYLRWDELRALVAGGAGVGSHSCSHPNFRTIDAARADAELVRSRAVLESRLGIDVHEFAIPFGQSGDWDHALTEQARAAGYDVLYAQSERRRPHGTVPRTFITRYDDDRTFIAALEGAFDDWEEWA